jgi:hypothetical protein
MSVGGGRGKGKQREGNNQKKEPFLITTPQEPRGQAEDRIECVGTRDRVKKVRGKGLSVQHMGVVAVTVRDEVRLAVIGGFYLLRWWYTTRLGLLGRYIVQDPPPSLDLVDGKYDGVP